MADSNKIKNIDIKEHKEFKDNFKVSILLSLLESSLITKQQFDYCAKEIYDKSTHL